MWNDIDMTRAFSSHYIDERTFITSYFRRKTKIKKKILFHQTLRWTATDAMPHDHTYTQYINVGRDNTIISFDSYSSLHLCRCRCCFCQWVVHWTQCLRLLQSAWYHGLVFRQCQTAHFSTFLTFNVSGDKKRQGYVNEKQKQKKKELRSKKGKKCQCVIRLSIAESICFCFVCSFVLAAYDLPYQTGFWKRRVHHHDRPTEWMYALFAHIDRRGWRITFWKDFYFGFTPARSHCDWCVCVEVGGRRGGGSSSVVCICTMLLDWIIATRDEILSGRG